MRSKSFDIIYAMTQGGPGHGVGDDQHLSLQHRLRLLRHRLLLGHGGRVLRHHRGAVLHPADAAPAPQWSEAEGK